MYDTIKVLASQLLMPLPVSLGLMALGFALMAWRCRRAGVATAAIGLAILVLASWGPVAERLLEPLEARYPALEALPENEGLAAVVVPEQINLHRFHELIQDVMGWGGCHLYEFECSGRYYGEPDEWSDRSIALARNAKLKALAARAKGGAFHYLYDFGDGWQHRIVIEATGLKETNPCPRLIDGAIQANKRIRLC